MQGPLTMDANRTPLFTQLYFLNPQQANEARLTNMPQLRLRGLSGLLETLDLLLRHQNPYHHIFLRAKDAHMPVLTDPTAPLGSEPAGRPSV
jgi:hypothetical protein